MSQSNALQKLPFIAGASLISSMNLLVKADSTEGQVIVSTADARVLGVLDNKPASGQEAAVIVSGSAKIVAGGNITYGAYIVSDGSGQAIVKTAEVNIVGIALQAGASGDLVEVLLMPLLA